MPTIDFYVLTDTAPDAHFRHACRLAEQAVEQGQRVFIRVDLDDAKRIDDLLWTFGDRSFLPHEIATPASPSHELIRVLIGSDPPATFRDVLVNLHTSIPAEAQSLPHIIELVPADDERKRAARARFKAYRDVGLNPATQNV